MASRIASRQPSDRAQNLRDLEALRLALRESQTRYHRLLEAVTDYTFTVLLEQGEPVETLHGAGCIRITGYHPDDFDKDPFLWINIVHPEDRDTVLEHSANVLQKTYRPWSTGSFIVTARSAGFAVPSFGTSKTECSSAMTES